MVSVNFIHESFSSGSKCVPLSIVPNEDSYVTLDGTDYKVYRVFHIVRSGPMSKHSVNVMLFEA